MLYLKPMDKIEELLTRGVEKIYPSKEELEKVLRSGKKLKLYQGFDPTGAQLHIGHMVGLRKLRQWQELGHHVIFLIGDFTATIGDPTGKYDTRKMLTYEEVLKNAEFYKQQAGKILHFTGENPVEIRFNGEWLNKISGMEFLKIAGLLSVQQVVERDMFQERQKRGQDIYMNEFLYPIMQAYDCVAMNVDLEVGGSDQMFNMLMGRKLMRNMIKKDKFVMTTPLLTDSKGMKIGKTEGNVIGLTDKPEALFAKIMALPDDFILKGFEYLTDIPMQKINDIKKSIDSGESPMKHKKMLAFEIAKQLNTEKYAMTAQESFQKVVQTKKLPKNIPVYQYIGSRKENVIGLLMQTKLVNSRAEAKRLVEQKGVTIDGQTAIDANLQVKIKNDMIIKVGKRRFVKIKLDAD